MVMMQCGLKCKEVVPFFIIFENLPTDCFTYKACIRIKRYPTVTATFDKMSDAKIWVAENEAPRKKGLHIKNCSAQKA